jgi:site-specific recombinase XerD
MESQNIEKQGINSRVNSIDELSRTQLGNCIDEIIITKRKYNLTPEQNRYIDKRVRELLKLQIPKVQKTLPDFLNASEIHYILKTAQEKSPFDSLLIEFLIFTGLRINEAKNLLIPQIDFQNNQLKVIQGKGSKDRYVPISDNLLHKIKLYIGDRKSGYLWVKRNLTAFTKRALQKRITHVIKACNFDKKLTTHSLRHSFACLCLAKGLRLEDIKLMMGHDTIKTTEIYAKLELGSIKEQYLQLMGGLS